MVILGVTTLIGFAVTSALGIGLSFLAAALGKKKGPKFTFDNRPTPVATRGVFVPRVIGRRRITHTFGWAGKRKVVTKGGGGKSLGGGGEPEQKTYTENGWHLLCVGGSGEVILHGVFLGSKRIWPRKDTPMPNGISSADTPGGTVLNARGEQGKFEIWWGTHDQAINPRLQKVLPGKPLSGWPNMVYVYWRPKNLGPSPVWPELTYDVEVRVRDCVPGSVAQLGSGVNPAHAMWESMTAPFPYGMGIDPATVDATGLIEMGQRFEDEDLGINVYASDGQTCAELLADLMAEMGFVMPQVGGALRPNLIREQLPNPDPIPAVTDLVAVDPDPEMEQHHGDFNPDRVIYIIKDVDRSFEDTDVQLDDHSQARAKQRVQPRRVSLNTVTSAGTAQEVAKRMRLVDMTSATAYKFKATRDARLLVPGQRFHYPDIGTLRVGEITMRWDSREVDVGAVHDHYSFAPGSYLPGGGFAGAERETSFAVIGDFGNTANTKLVAALVKGWAPEFVVTVGDNAYEDDDLGTNGIKKTWRDFHPSRMLYAIGNHDQDRLAAFLQFARSPGNERYFDVVRGPVHFFFVNSDPREADGIVQGSTQGQWLQEQLGRSAAAWRVVVAHHPPYSSGALHGGTPDLRWPFLAWGADLVLSGHDHDYERLVVDQMTYVVNGLGGHSHRAFGTPVAGSLLRFTGQYGAQRCTADSRRLRLEFVTLDGVVRDTLELLKPYDPEDVDDSEALPDLYHKPLAVPGRSAIVVPRVRAHQRIEGATVHVSADGTAYLLAGVQDPYAAGGTLNGALLCGEDETAEGPTITSYNLDIEEVLDLSGNEPGWRAGEQLCVIGDEAMYIKKVTAVSGGYRLDGLIRGQFGTTATNHAPGERVIIFQRSQVTVIEHALLTAGATVQVKTQPRTGDETADLGDVTAEEVVLP